MALKFATFNLYQFSEPPVACYEIENFYSENDWVAKKKWVEQQLTDMDADVIGFQEVFSIDALRQLVTSLGYSEFRVVEKPRLIDAANHVYGSSVVAIASRHPITQISSVEVQEKFLGDMPVSEDFQFSRLPIKAVIELPTVGNTTFYVAHLKSKLPAVPETTLQPGASWRDKTFSAAKAVSLGQITSMVLRGVEATMIYQDVMTEINRNANIPIVVMGDMNDSEGSVVIDALSNQYARFEVDGINYNDWPDEAKVASFQAKLYDAYYLAPNQAGGRRRATHFYRKEGNVLDYIFISNAFHDSNPDCLAIPSAYNVFDTHLNADDEDNKMQSDHAQVLLTLLEVS